MDLTAPPPPATYTAPVEQTERLVILDSLRGIAILGILLMNIPGFGLPLVMIEDISIRQEYSGINFYVWAAANGVFEGTLRSIFSMLFGAGMLLFIGRLEKRLPGLLPAEYFFRRQLWLLAFGLFDAYLLLWSGDILFKYALCGMLLFAFKNLSPKHLIIASFACLIMFTTRENIERIRTVNEIEAGEKALLLKKKGASLTTKQSDAIAFIQGMKEENTPEAKREKAEVETRLMQGNYAEVYQNRSADAYRNETSHFFYHYVWDILIFMFLGMAFFKTGVLTGAVPTRTYLYMLLVGLGIGALLSYYNLYFIYRVNYNWYEYHKQAPFSFYEIARVFRSLGFFALVMLLYKVKGLQRLFDLMRPVGQMAFTNYLMQSILCGLVFYGFGLGLYGKLQRYELYYVVGAVWIVQIIYSHIWLRYYRFGPFEWAWRSLTYWKMQPMRKVERKDNTIN
jgi:uncharacterized protein